jgi:hypothetical protein
MRKQRMEIIWIVALFLWLMTRCHAISDEIGALLGG